jgi:hypothetical protein
MNASIEKTRYEARNASAYMRGHSPGRKSNALLAAMEI